MKPVADPVFDAYMAFLLSPDVEGEHSNDPTDRGGETWHGLSRAFLDSIGWTGKPPTRDQAINLYRKHFWRGRRCHEMDPLVAFCAADAYVQHPERAAALMIQQGLGVDLDGVVGPLTIEAAQTPDVRAFWQRYRLARVRYYNDIVAGDATQAKWIDGWQDRLHKLAEALYDNGLFGSGVTRKPSILTHENTKAAAAGTGLFALVAAILTAIGVDVSAINLADIPELTTDVGIPSLLVGVIGWILTKVRPNA